MTIKNGDMPAMPIFNAEGFVSKVESGALSGWAYGLTKREQFAMAAMQGIMSNQSRYESQFVGSKHWIEVVSEHAVKVADALLLELGKGEK